MKKFSQFLKSSELSSILMDKTVTDVPLVETKLSRVFQHIEDDSRNFGIVSSFRSANSEEENQANHEELKKKVREMGYGYVELRGGYRGDEGFAHELSLMIPNIKKREVVGLGREYAQHSVIYKNKKDFYYIGTNEEAGIGKVLMNFRKGEGQDNMDLAKEKVVDFFSSLRKGPHSDKKFVFKPTEQQPTEGGGEGGGAEEDKHSVSRHKPGDIWKTSSGLWGGMNAAGKYEYFDDDQAAKRYAKKNRAYQVQEREEWNFAKAAYLRRGESPKWITIIVDGD